MSVTPARVVFSAADRAEIVAAIEDILTTGSLTLGPYTRAFEQACAVAHEAPHAVATASGTAALEIILRILGVSGRAVIVPANTFYATAGAVLHAGARPIFADVDPGTMALSVEKVQAALTSDVAAVILVHIGGLITAEAEALRALCADRGIALVEDAAHAHGSTWEGRFAGSFGVAAALSFYPTKVVTSGEGGMILTSSAELTAEARIYRDQGKGEFETNQHVRLGYAWRMSELQAATGLVHLRGMDGAIGRRRQVAARYNEAMADHPGLEPLAEPPGSRTNYYKYVLLLPPGVNRAEFKDLVAARGVRLAGEVYETPLHRQPALAEYGAGLLPVAEDLCARHVCLPIHSDMRDGEIDEVLTAVAAAHKVLVGAA